MTDYKTVPFELLELKESRDAWSFSGYASTFGNIDLGGDVVLPGAFAESLKVRPKPRLLWTHEQTEPIGVPLSLKEDERGLRGEWKISKTTRGHDAYVLLKDGAIDSMSIGYVPVDSEFTNDGVRKLKSIDLLEVSLVAMPMNEEALVTSVKAAAEAKAEWTSAYINDLPDSAFAVIESGGKKDDDGKTTPRSLRHFPHHNSSGALDLPHLRNALSRAPQSSFGDRAMPHLRKHASAEGVGGKDRLLILAEVSADAAIAAAVEALERALPEMPTPADEAEAKHIEPTITQLRLRIAHKRAARRGVETLAG